MSCPHAQDDAAYVLGALSPGDRTEFERHLSGCRQCARSVQGLAGLPGLLGRVRSDVLEQPADHPVPSTLVPALSRRVRRARRRTTAAVAAAAALVAGVVAGVAVPVALSRVDGSSVAAPVAGRPGVVSRVMEPVGKVPLHAEVVLERVTWGTKVDLACTYDPADGTAGLPTAVDYVLFVRTRDGHTEQVGSWRSVAGRTMRLSAATATSRADIASVEVRAPDGSVLLTMAG